MGWKSGFNGFRTGGGNIKTKSVELTEIESFLTLVVSMIRQFSPLHVEFLS